MGANGMSNMADKTAKSGGRNHGRSYQDPIRTRIPRQCQVVSALVEHSSAMGA